MRGICRPSQRAHESRRNWSSECSDSPGILRAQKTCVHIEEDAQKEAADKKQDRGQNTELGGSGPHIFGHSVSKVKHGSLTAIGATCGASVWNCNSARKEKGTRREEGESE